MSALGTLRRRVTRHKQKALGEAVAKPLKKGAYRRRCGPIDAGMQRLGLRIYLHYTKGYRTRREPAR